MGALAVVGQGSSTCPEAPLQADSSEPGRAPLTSPVWGLHGAPVSQEPSHGPVQSPVILRRVQATLWGGEAAKPARTESSSASSQTPETQYLQRRRRWAKAGHGLCQQVVWICCGRSPGPLPQPLRGSHPPVLAFLGSVCRHVRGDTAPAWRSDPVTAQGQQSEVRRSCRRRPALGFLDTSEHLLAPWLLRMTAPLRWGAHSGDTTQRAQRGPGRACGGA